MLKDSLLDPQKEQKVLKVSIMTLPEPSERAESVKSVIGDPPEILSAVLKSMIDVDQCCAESPAQSGVSVINVINVVVDATALRDQSVNNC